MGKWFALNHIGGVLYQAGYCYMSISALYMGSLVTESLLELAFKAESTLQ
jgi:hypothetical protein